MALELSDTEMRDAEEECRAKAQAALADGDWYEAYIWTKSWITRGGARRVEPWLLYVASALQQGWPKTGVHSSDKGRHRPGNVGRVHAGATAAVEDD